MRTGLYTCSGRHLLRSECRIDCRGEVGSCFRCFDFLERKRYAGPRLCPLMLPRKSIVAADEVAWVRETTQGGRSWSENTLVRKPTPFLPDMGRGLPPPPRNAEPNADQMRTRPPKP